MNRLVSLFSVIFSAAVVCGVISCGGGGGEDTVDDDIRILDEYQYSLVTLSNTIYAGFTRSEGTTAYAHSISIFFPGDGLSGTYNHVSGTLTLTDESSSINVNTDLGLDPLLGSFTIIVTQTFTLPDDGFPTSGEMEIGSLAGDVITARFNSNAGGAGVPGMDILYDDDNEDPSNTVIGPIGYSWSDFEELFGSDAAETFEQKASLSFNLIDFVFEQMDYVLEAFGMIDDNEEILQTVNPVTTMCDAFSGNVPPITMRPEGVPDQGTMDFQWIDVLGGETTGEVGPGDDFIMSFSDCWVNDHGDEYDDLIDGNLEFTGYIDVVEVVDDVETLTMIGFEEIAFDKLELSETYENPPGTATLEEDTTVTMDGTFGLWFFAP